MQKRLWLLVFGLIVMASGCSKPEEATGIEAPSVASSEKTADAGAAVPGSPGADAPSDGTAPLPNATPRKIIYTANVSLITDDLAKAGAALQARVKAMGGYVSSANVTGAAGTTRQGTWTVRLPVGGFDAFMAGVAEYGTVESSTRDSQDVSEEFYDVQARLKNKRLEEARLLQHLKTSTAKLSDILEVEREISRVREEIERLEGRLRFLANQTDLTTITIQISERTNYKPEAPPSFGNQVAHAFTKSLESLGNFGKGLVIFVVAASPWLLVLGVIGGIVLVWRKQKMKTR